jgi:hypothetical protein
MQLPHVLVPRADWAKCGKVWTQLCGMFLEGPSGQTLQGEHRTMQGANVHVPQQPQQSGPRRQCGRMLPLLSGPVEETEIFNKLEKLKIFLSTSSIFFGKYFLLLAISESFF